MAKKKTDVVQQQQSQSLTPIDAATFAQETDKLNKQMFDSQDNDRATNNKQLMQQRQELLERYILSLSNG